MQDILREIYTSSFALPYVPTKEYTERLHAVEALWAKAAEVIGAEQAEAIKNAEAQLSLENEVCSFRQGFRLGAQLMLELK